MFLIIQLVLLGPIYLEAIAPVHPAQPTVLVKQRVWLSVLVSVATTGHQLEKKTYHAEVIVMSIIVYFMNCVAQYLQLCAG